MLVNAAFRLKEIEGPHWRNFIGLVWKSRNVIW